jgi:cell division septum initiation protein DivIVA
LNPDDLRETIETMAADETTQQTQKNGEAALPTVRRGYDREATDELLSALRGNLATANIERDEARKRVDDLEQQLAGSRMRESEITEALLVASRVRDDAEREGTELKARYEQEAEATLSASEQKAAETVAAAEQEAEATRTEAQAALAASEQKAEETVAAAEEKAQAILAAAEVEAEKVVGDAKLRIRGLEQEVRDAEQVAVDARARVTALLESLLAEVERRGTEPDSAFDDLLARAGDVARGGTTAAAESEPEPEAATGAPAAVEEPESEPAVEATATAAAATPAEPATPSA